MRKDIVYLEMIRCSDIMSLNTSDEGYNNDKKYGKKGAICGPNSNDFSSEKKWQAIRRWRSRSLMGKFLSCGSSRWKICWWTKISGSW
jgi:hypothetical protein